MYTIQTIMEVCMGKFIDRTGHKYGRLTVIGRTTGLRIDKVYWECGCDCGSYVSVVSGDLATGHSMSCGCLNKEIITKHGGWNKSSYNTWRAMIRRCNNINDKDYKNYGAKGVTVCAQWMEYNQFVADMGEPTGSETLDRIDPIDGYYPDNCRWASPTQQIRNQRPKTHKYGVAGIKPTKSGKWTASITAELKRYYSPVCNTLEEAISHRKQLELKHWETTNG